jgi:hypothetical protein
MSVFSQNICKGKFMAHVVNFMVMFYNFRKAEFHMPNIL